MSKTSSAKRFKISHTSWIHTPLHEERQALSANDCRILIGSCAHGDIHLPSIHISLSRTGLKTLALALVQCVLSNEECVYLRCVTQDATKGILLKAAKPPAHPKVDVPKEFDYRPSRKILKRYPWYPQSVKWNALTELPSFGITEAPATRAYPLLNGILDSSKPHAVSIAGYPSALFRLARLLLDYANANDPPEEVTLELEGGFRGVGHFSYQAGFEIIT